jgi:hypothetical protein
MDKVEIAGFKSKSAQNRISNLNSPTSSKRIPAVQIIYLEIEVCWHFICLQHWVYIDSYNL